MARTTAKTLIDGPYKDQRMQLPIGGTFKFRVREKEVHEKTRTGRGVLVYGYVTKNWCGYYNAEGIWIDCGSLVISRREEDGKYDHR